MSKEVRYWPDQLVTFRTFNAVCFFYIIPVCDARIIEMDNIFMSLPLLYAPLAIHPPIQSVQARSKFVKFAFFLFFVFVHFDHSPVLNKNYTCSELHTKAESLRTRKSYMGWLFRRINYFTFTESWYNGDCNLNF